MDETKDHSRVTPEGQELGRQFVRLAEPIIKALEAEGEDDDRCKSCAGRLGTVPNGCVQTQMDLLKAVLEGVPFCCHQHGRRGMPCHAWYAARVGMKGATVEVPWEFSPADDET